MKRILLSIVAAAALAACAMPAEAHWGLRAGFRAPFRGGYGYRQNFVVRQQFVAPVYAQAFVQPIYAQPVYAQAVVAQPVVQAYCAPQAIVQGYSQPVVGGGCGQFFRGGY